jgi:histidyl-tRNA synthetase
MQFDADTVGAPTMAADAEMCMLAADTMEALGIKRGDYVVKVNNRKVVDGVMDAAEIAPDKRLIVLRAIDKFDRLGADGVRMLLGAGRKDESGDFTKGAGLNPNQIGKVLKYIELQFAEELGDLESVLEDWQREVGISSIGKEGVEELARIAALVRAAGYGSNKIAFESSVVRGLEYYTGPVYEVDLTFEIDDEKGRPVRFGSVGGGGRYDGLVSRFRGEPVPATGFSIGVSRLQAALTALGKLGETAPAGPVLVTVFGAESVSAGQTFATRLRNAGIRAELYLGNPKHGIGQQLKYADKRGSPCAVIQGPDEKAKGEVQIRDLIAGSALSDIKERDAYLKQQAQAQLAVKEAQLVEEVRKLLARHGL